MKSSQKGFTLVEIAIVLVIIGLLLGGVLKGQELINSAKVKNLATDFRNLPVFVYAYQDKYRKLPGDDDAAPARFTPALDATHKGNGNGALSGLWNLTGGTDEPVLFWEHVRRSGIAAGPTDFSSATAIAASLPTNAEGGRFGVGGTVPITGMNGGSFYACSDGIDGRFATQLDLTMDDGKSNSGSMQAIAQGTGGTTQAIGGATATPAAAYAEGTRYTVCMTY